MFLKDLEKKLEKNKSHKTAKEKLLTDVLYRVGRMVYEGRLIKKMTQKELANKLKTKQPVIAKIENGNYNISLKYLEKIAKVFNTRLIPPKFEFMNDIEEKYNKEMYNCLSTETKYETIANNEIEDKYFLPEFRKILVCEKVISSNYNL